MTKITVLGADGFIGRHLVFGLANMPDMNITAFSRFTSILRNNEPHPFDKLRNVKITPGDFFNHEDLRNAVKDADYVFHLVTTSTPASSVHDPLIDIDTNIRGSVELFQLCAEANVKRVIYFSSGGSVYGNVSSGSIKETDPLSPLSPYAIGKVAVENYLEYFLHSRKLDYIVYRVSNPYGPGQNIHGKQGVIPIFMRHFIENEPIVIFGDGEMVRDYIYINDLINMVCSTFNKPSKSHVYNLGSGEGTSVNRIVQAIEDKSGKTVKKTRLDTPPTYVERIVLNIDRFSSEFKLFPAISFNEGIERTWNYVKSIK